MSWFRETPPEVGSRALTGPAAGVTWGFAEGALFFIVPDVLISRTALISWRGALLQSVAAVAGAVLAGALMFAWAVRAPDAAFSAVRHVPFVRESMFSVAAAGLDAGPLAALLRGSFSGIPYKVYAVEAPTRVPAGKFLVASVPARGLRFLLVAGCAALAAALFRRLTSLGTSGLYSVHGAAWLAFYAYYWLTI